jgi:hypothetical protein
MNNSPLQSQDFILYLWRVPSSLPFVLQPHSTKVPEMSARVMGFGILCSGIFELWLSGVEAGGDVRF